MHTPVCHIATIRQNPTPRIPQHTHLSVGMLPLRSKTAYMQPNLHTRRGNATASNRALLAGVAGGGPLPFVTETLVGAGPHHSRLGLAAWCPRVGPSPIMVVVLVAGGPHQSWLGPGPFSPGGGPSPILAEVRVGAVPRHSWPRPAACSPGGGPSPILAEVRLGAGPRQSWLGRAVCSLWVVPCQSWLRSVWVQFLANPGRGLLLALPGVVPRQSWQRSLWVPFPARLGRSCCPFPRVWPFACPGCVSCVLGVVPRHSWLGSLCVGLLVCLWTFLDGMGVWCRCLVAVMCPCPLSVLRALRRGRV